MSFETDTRLDMFGDWANAFPGPMDGWINSALSGFEDLLFKLSGDPDVLSTLHTVWTTDQDVPRDLAIEQSIHRGNLLQSWDAASRAAFDTNMAKLEAELPLLGENFGALAGLLKDSAEAAIATVNAIVDLIVGLLIWALAEAIIAAGAALLTFGASVAAWFGSTAIKFGIATTRVTAMVAQLQSIILAILVALDTAALAVTTTRNAGVIAWLLLKETPNITPAIDAGDDL